MYEVNYKKQAAKYLAKLPKNIRDNIFAALSELSLTGEHNSSTQLKGRDGYRLRVGEYRVIYSKNETGLTILVVKIGARGGVYK
jgi:mRNA interferase RelE/StbE